MSTTPPIPSRPYGALETLAAPGSASRALEGMVEEAAPTAGRVVKPTGTRPAMMTRSSTFVARLRGALLIAGAVFGAANVVWGVTTGSLVWGVLGLAIAVLALWPVRVLDIERGWLVFALVLAATGGIDSPLVVLGAPLAFLRSARGPLGKHDLFALALLIAGFWGLATARVTADVWLPMGLLAAVDPLTRVVIDTLALGGACVLAAVTAGYLIDATAREAGVGTRLNDAADETLDARGDDMLGLLRSVASTLAEPIGSLVSRADALRRAGALSAIQPQLAVLADEAIRLERLLIGLGDFARPLTAADCAPVALRAVVEQVVATQEPAAEAKGLRVVVEGEADVEACRTKVVQLVVNLVQNAIAASPPGGTLTVTVAAAEERAQITIADEGPGIAPAVRARLFTPGATTRSAGSGMGLVVARALAEQHGGRVELDDGAVGAVATVWLPSTPRFDGPAAASRRPVALEALARLIRFGPRIGLVLVTSAAVLSWMTTSMSLTTGVLAGLSAALAWAASRPHLSAVDASGVVLGAQTLVVVCTGGLTSPLVIALPAGVVMSRLATRGPTQWVRWVILAGVIGALFWAAAPPAVMPSGIDALGHVGNYLLFAVAWTATLVVGSRSGAAVRGALRAMVEHRRAARARLADAQSRRNEALLGLAGGVAHEVKNPLAAVLGLAALLADRAPDGHPTRATLRGIAADARTVSQTLSRFLDFSRPLSPLTRQAEPLAEALSDAVEVARAAAEARGVEVALRAGPRVMVWADRRKLRQLLAAALEDRIAYAAAGATLWVGLDATADYARITLTLSSADRARVRPPAAHVIARTLVEQHGGSFVEWMSADIGPRLELTLPLTPTEAPP